VTDLAEKMVCQWGMSDKIGPITFNRGEEHPFLGRKLATEKTFSEQMAWLIDQEIEKIVKKGEEMADQLVTENCQALQNLAAALLEEEVLERYRVDEILEKSGVSKGGKTKEAGEAERDADFQKEA
jgi:cell division protease FtsH